MFCMNTITVRRTRRLPRRCEAIVCILVSLATSSAGAGTFTVNFERTDGGGSVPSGGSLEYDIKGFLSNEDNIGLALFLYDLEIVNGPAAVNLSTALAQSPGPQMDPFYPDLGYALMYNGSPVGNDMLQAGGAQNTVRNNPASPPFLPFPSGPVVLNVGHDPAGVVLHQGTLTLPVDAPAGDYTFRIKPASLTANMVTAFDGVFYTVASATPAIGTEITFQYVGIPPECLVAADCADTNQNNVRDDNCKWFDCSVACSQIDIVFADMGGTGNDCMPDGAADANDKFHALRCFADVDAAGQSPYPCAKINVDAGGPGLACCPDGTCDANDAFAALNAFAGHPNGCTCPLQSGTQSCSPTAAVQPVAPRIVDHASLTAVASQRAVHPGQSIDVNVMMDTPLADLRGYQLHLGVTGGKQGRLELVNIAIQPRRDRVFAAVQDWNAFNVKTGQMLAGLDGGGIGTLRNGYLATFTYRASADAIGTFVVDVLGYEAAHPDRRTFLFGSGDGMIALDGTKPAVVVVDHPRAASVR